MKRADIVPCDVTERVTRVALHQSQLAPAANKFHAPPQHRKTS